MATATAPTPPQSAEAHYEARRLVKLEKLKDAVGSLTNERDAAKAENARLVKEIEVLKAKTDNSALAKQNTELVQKLRTLEHRKTFDRLATERGANPAALDILFEKSGWKAEADEFDEAEMAAVIDQQKPLLPFLFGGEKGPAPPLVKPGAGSGQGTVAGKKAGESGDVIREEDPRWGDPVFAMKNYDKLVLSAQERIQRGEV